MSCFLVKFLYIYSFSSFFLYNPLFQVIHGRIFCLLHRENHSPLPTNNSYHLSRRLPVPAILQKPATTAPVYIFGCMPMPPTDGAERRMPTVYRHWSTKNGTESELRKNGSNWLTAFYPGNPLPPPPFPQDSPLQDYISGFTNTRKWDILAL